jgi:LuxR family maltose regulon positive regulatory protein
VRAAEPEAGVAAPLLVETKLVPPRPRPEVVPRPRLFRRLDELAPAALTLVDAPVGFGKTLLVQSWCDEQPELPAAWINLDAADNDPVRLWTYVATAVDRIRPGLGRGALSRLRVPGGHVETSVDEVINGLAAYGAPVVIVFDDLHVLTDAACLDSLQHATERLPESARIVATTRSDPALRLGRLRARGALGEIRSRDLAFDRAEARALFALEQIELENEDLALLVQRTEGWPAGLYLAALWLGGLEDVAQGVRDFAGDNRHVADYLSAEVLGALPADRRAFMLRTAVLGQFSAPLCDDVLGLNDSAKVLGELAHSNMFLVPLDARWEWFRYHHLFGELLRLELASEDSTAAAAIHRRASDWYRRRGWVDEAINHAAAAGDDEAVAELLDEHHVALIDSGRAATVLRWVDALPTDLLLEYPALPAVGGAAALLLARPGTERRRFLALAERARDERPERWTPFPESLVAVVRSALVEGDVREAIRNAHRTIEIGGQMLVPGLASLAYALFLAGDLTAARASAQAAVERPEAAESPHGLMHALGTLALLDAEEGRAHAAGQHAARALEVAMETGIANAWSAGPAHSAAAVAFAGEGRLRNAERTAERGELLCRQDEPTAPHVHALLVLAEIRAANGRLTRASAELEQAREAIAGFTDPGRLAELARGVERTIADAKASTDGHIDAPSEAELAVLQLLASDLSQREIGLELYLSLNTVKTHTRRLYRKLGVSSRETAVRRAAALGLLESVEQTG